MGHAPEKEQNGHVAELGALHLDSQTDKPQNLCDLGVHH